MKKLILVCFIVFTIIDVFIVCTPYIVSAIKRKKEKKAKEEQRKAFSKRMKDLEIK